MTEPRARRRIVVRGRVQGVGFRWFTLRHAQRLGLRGTVANRPDGTVEAVVEGPEPAIEEIVGTMRRGPSGARVDDVVVLPETSTAPLPMMSISG